MSTILGALLVIGCPDRAEREAPAPSVVLIRQLDVEDHTPQPRRITGVDAAVVREWVVQAIAAAAQMKLDPAADRGSSHVLKLELGIGQRREGPDELRNVLLISARAAPPSRLEGLILQASAADTLPATEDAKVLKGAVRAAVGRLMQDLAYQAKLGVGSAQDVVRALGDKDVQRVAVAVEMAALRRIGESVPRLVELLEHDDERISDRAIGALVAIGDRRAVKSLTRVAKFKETAKMAKIIDAIGALGGSEARDYLQFVATGHEDADIRNLAAEALARLERAQGRKPAAGAP